MYIPCSTYLSQRQELVPLLEWPTGLPDRAPWREGVRGTGQSGPSAKHECVKCALLNFAALLPSADGQAVGGTGGHVWNALPWVSGPEPTIHEPIRSPYRPTTHEVVLRHD